MTTALVCVRPCRVVTRGFARQRSARKGSHCILLIPRPAAIKAQPSVDRNGERGESRRQDLAITGANPTAVIALACAR